MSIGSADEGLASSALEKQEQLVTNYVAANGKLFQNLMVLEAAPKCPFSRSGAVSMFQVLFFEPKRQYERKQLNPLCERLLVC
jgi:hypothetical protein